MRPSYLRIQESTRVHDIYVHVCCQETGRRFRFRLDGLHTERICNHCSHETFDVYADPEPDRVAIELYTTSINGTFQIEPEQLEIDTSRPSK